MANIVLKCPVCGAALTDDICPQCGYVHLYFPTSVPKAIDDFQKRRVEVLKEVTKRHSDQLDEANRDAGVARQQAERLRADLGRANDTVRNLNDTIMGQNSRTGDLERELNKEKAAKNREQGVLNSRITDLQSVVNLQTSEISDLKRSLNDAQNKLIELSNTPSKTLKGVVIVEDVRHGIRTALPVYEGLNTYGSNPDKDSHCQIKFHIRGFNFLPVHFSIRTSAKGLIIEGTYGVNIYQNGGLIKSGVYARQADNFMLDDKVRINVTRI